MFIISSFYYYLDKFDSLVNDNYNWSVYWSIKMKFVDVIVFNV